MPQLAQVLRTRRERRLRAHSQHRWGVLGVVAAGAVTLAVGLIVIALALTFSDLAASLPPVDDLERIFGGAGREAFRPARFYDRSGEILLFETINPAAEGRRWIYLEPDGPIDLPAYALQAFLVALDQDFWNHPGYHRADAVTAIADYLFTPGTVEGTLTITQRLARAQLSPLSLDENPAAGQVQSILLAAEITRRYPREQILEWYLNSADFGQGAFGIDAAALVYFGKHASDLTLAESALLASIPLDPAANPLDQPQAARDAQQSVLQALAASGVVTVDQARRATFEQVQLAKPSPVTITAMYSFKEYSEAYLQAAFGRDLLGRSGLRVLTSLDHDLQQQAACTLSTQVARLNGGDASAVIPAGDGTGCIAAGLLPPLRPKDAGADHGVTSGALVILDTDTGEVLSLIGEAGVARPAEPVLAPLVALTAFSQGYSPASMLIDVAVEGDANPNPAQEHGPVRLRIALANNYRGALDHLQASVGLESVARTVNSLGLREVGEALSHPGEASGLDASLLDLSYAYSVFAGEGTLHGSAINAKENELLEPIVILQIEDGTRRLIFQSQHRSRAIVSAQLSYLMVDVLSDETARWPSFGRGNPLEIGRPAGGLSGVTEDGGTAWTLGFTPQVVVGVRLEAGGSPTAAPLTSLNAAAPIWHAAMQYAGRDQEQASWRLPPGVSSLEVCDPSGLLPTNYCPNVVRELFINGTEPTTFDNLFQPYRVNRETGKLATLDTPLELVEERVYMIAPPEAADWALAAGIPQPPQEYDTLRAETSEDSQVRITSPAPFDFLRGQVRIVGYANPSELRSYRLQYGRGLNPDQWVQVGADVEHSVRGGTLGTWDTGSLSGLFTLQLIVVESSGRLRTASVPVTIDNQPPAVDVELPLEGQVITAEAGDEIVLQAGVSDEYGVAELTFFIDGQPVATILDEPWSTRWNVPASGEYEIYAEATDFAGNVTSSSTITFLIQRP
jgi:membrane peptidoglycan carboxypeptidase